MELKFSNDLESAKRLDKIMNSYSGQARCSVMADGDALAILLVLLEHGKITVTEHAYPYDRDIRSDSGMMEVYSKLARKTRWRLFQHTEIEGVRLNALRQMRGEGTPSYDGEFVCYREGRVFVHCGNLAPSGLLMHLADYEQAEQLCLFTYPYQTEDQTANYYRFDLSETAMKGARIYRESVWEEMRRAADARGDFLVISQDEDDPESL